MNDYDLSADAPEAVGDEILASSIKLMDWGALAHVEPQPRDWVIPNVAPAGEVTLLTGAGSAGKSLMMQQLATGMAVGVPTLGFDMGWHPAIYMTCEDKEPELHRRQVAICNSLEVPMASLAGKFHAFSASGELDNGLLQIEGYQSGKAYQPTAAFDRLAALARKRGAWMVVLDNVGHLFRGNENDRGEVTQFVNLLNRLAGETGAAVVLVAHPNKSGDNYSGSTAWLNAVRSQATLTMDDSTHVRSLTVGKANYGTKGEVARFVWYDWAFVHEDDLPADQRAEMDTVIQASADNLLFLDCLRQRNKEKRAVSERPTSRTYAPKEFAGMPESKNIGKDRLEAAMDRLFRTGAIERGKLWRGDDRKFVFGLRETAGDLHANDNDGGWGLAK